MSSIQQDGYTIIPGLISSSEIELIFSHIHRILDQALKNAGDGELEFKSIDQKYLFLKSNHPELKSHCYDLISKIDILTFLSSDSRVLSRVRPVVGETVLVDRQQIRIDDNSNDRLLPFHQEVFGQISRECLTMWCPLVDIHEENGPLQIVPGSHLQGPVPHKFYPEMNNYHGVAQKVPEKSVLKVKAKAGDAVIFHPLTFHASSPNRTEDLRWTFITRYNSIHQVPYLEDPKASLYIEQRQDVESH